MKEFLSQNGIAYQERRVDSDQEAYKEFTEQKLGMGVPVVVVDGQKVVGFDRPKLTELLGLSVSK